MKQKKHQKIALTRLQLNSGQLEGLPQNPRYIKDEKFHDLCRSIETSPEFLDARPLLVYPLDGGNFITICGNMRLRACRELGMKEAPCYVFPKNTHIEKLREYTIKDNVPFGQTDWDVLKEWDMEELKEWSFDVPDGWMDEELPPLEDEPDNLVQENKDKPFVIKVVCEDEKQLKEFAQDIQQLINEKYESADFSVTGGEL